MSVGRLLRWCRGPGGYHGAPWLFFDSNFYTLWEATALIAGDHPHRDFFEWGMPLQMMTSVVGQVISGHRLIGEFGLHWVFILAGALIAAHLGYRLSAPWPRPSPRRWCRWSRRFTMVVP